MLIIKVVDIVSAYNSLYDSWYLSQMYIECSMGNVQRLNLLFFVNFIWSVISLRIDVQFYHKIYHMKALD